MNASAITGLLVAIQTKRVIAVLCRTCAISVVRSQQANTILAGWWGVTAFFVNLFVVIGNASTLRRLHKAPHPHPASIVAAPLDPGTPLTARPVVWVGAAIGLVLTLLFVIAIATA